MRAAAALGVLVLLVLAAAGCSCDGLVSSQSTGTGPGVTAISRPVHVEWRPAGEPSASDRAAVSDAVRSRGLSFLLPTPPPLADAAATSAEFFVEETVPTHLITLETVVRQEGEANPVVAVQSWTGEPPDGSADAQKVRVRGREGWARTPPAAVSMLDWEENGQRYHAEWVGLPLDQMIGWLDTWETVPSDGGESPSG